MKRGTLIVVGVVATAALASYIYYKKRQEALGTITANDLDDILEGRVLKNNFDEIEEELEEAIIPVVLYPDPRDILLDEDKFPAKGPDEEMRTDLDPNSEIALKEFISMHLSDFKDYPESARKLRRLFSYEWFPSASDQITYDTIIETRREFFGEYSVWAESITWADLLLYYGERAMFDLDNEIEHWVTYIFDHIDIDKYPDEASLLYLFRKLNKHTYIDDHYGYFGMFGLDGDGIDALKDSLNKSNYEQYSFEMEYNAFLSMYMAYEEDDWDE